MTWDFGGADDEYGVPDAEDDFETWERYRIAEDREDEDPPDTALAKAISLHDDEIHGPVSAEELAEQWWSGPDAPEDDEDEESDDGNTEGFLPG